MSAFGAVFSDVDLAMTTSLQFFTFSNAPLGPAFFVPHVAGNETFSFLGVQFNAGEQIARVRITTGNVAPGPNDGGGVDVVMMDDFIFAEPSPVPEPGTMTLLVLGLAVAGAVRRRIR